MKKIVKIIGIVLGSILALLAGFCIYVAISGVPTYDPPTISNLKVDVTASRIARGEAIAQIQCMSCHADKDNRVTGKYLAEVPDLFGKLYSKNITQDTEKGIGNWTDGELIYFLRTGVRRDGSYAPVMPQYPNMADEDIRSVVAWLRSDRFPVQASKQEPQASELSLISKVLTHTLMKPLPYPQTLVASPDSNDTIALGKYTADAIGDCYSCHSGDLIDQDKVHPSTSKGYYGGGIEMVGDGGKKVITANLTFDQETGIAKTYTKEQFIRAVRMGVRPDGSILNYPMEPKLSLSDREVGAIYDYLKTVPKIRNNVAQKNAELQLARK
ncbi:c-type cytochrome [Spirosoma endophyticum]|uniref:Cytochrome C oxidase, cbb3-type, subunit III n=1 Tax=Spirosoma endophyticum TaxID=662367 RepID=A0A1I1FEX8_9BACT|nr:cytochrome c [Spirosoma endophyticum]SFB96248.1 Cytochrome C oxidase, cbb3-type, subunit III [Spirosoma endophyticum]